MITPSEAVASVLRMIETKPDTWNASDFEFLVSVEFANALMNYVKPLHGQPLYMKITFFKGEEFTFRGYKFRVV